MAGVMSQPPTAPTSSRSSSVVNGNTAFDYINGHGGLPDSPASNATQPPAPPPPAAKKAKGKKATDPNETGKLLAAKINQLELDAAGEKDQEAEIGGCSLIRALPEDLLATMRKHDLTADMIAEMAKAYVEGQEICLMSADEVGDAATSEANLVPVARRALTKIFGSHAAQSVLDSHVMGQKLTDLLIGHYNDIEREVKKATRDLTSLLTGMETPLSRLEAVQKKYTELLADMKRLDRDHVKSKKRADQLQKDKDHGRSELSKTVSMKEKLEKLCRELTRENKKMKEEHKKLEDSEKRSREILGERVEGMIWEVEEVMQQKENPESQKLNMEMDELFRQKFKSFLDQYELRELHFHSHMRTKECEVQYNLARYEQQRKIAENEATRSRTLSAQVSTFSQTETELRSQLNIYVEKFKQVEDTLNNSNDLFLTFRKEMEEMSKKTKRLEKENLNLTRKHDLTNRNILEMAEERTRVNKEMENLRKKNNTLESVIRRMQDQGRGPAAGGAMEGDEEGTESDYEEDDYDEEEGSEDAEYDDDTEEEALQAPAGGHPAFGTIPPPPPPTQAMGNGKVNGEANGIKH